MAVKIFSKRLTFAVRFKTVLLPFDINQLLVALPNAGFVLAEDLPILPARTRLNTVSGVIAGRGEVIVRADTERQNLALDGPDADSVIGDFERIEYILRHEFELDLTQVVYFYEAVTAATVRGEKNPTAALSAFSGQIPFLGEIKTVFGSDLALFGIRLSRPNDSPNQPDWTEIRIEPVIRNANTHYGMDVVFRRVEREPVVKFLQQFESATKQVIGAIEK